MAVANPYQKYQQQSVMTASPAELTLMLYNGCIRFIKQAQIAIDDKDIEKANNLIIRAQDIIAEFMSTLKMDYDVSDNLMALYDYMNRRLIDANTAKNKDILQEVLELITDLRDTWIEVVSITRKQMHANKG